MLETNDPIASCLANAAISAEAGTRKSQENKINGTQIRASRIGLPLLQLVLEDLVLPDERMETLQKNDLVPKPRVQLPNIMRIATGHIFESAYLLELQARYGKEQVFHNLELKHETANGVIITGTLDFLVFFSDKTIEVRECKALNVWSGKEAEEKLLYDNWGYSTQLALYVDCVRKLYTEADVTGRWVVWCKKTERVDIVDLPNESIDELVKHAGETAFSYKCIQQAIERKDFATAAARTIVDTVELPMKHAAKNGSYYNSCGLHYRREADLFIERDGRMKPEDVCQQELEKLMTNNLTAQLIMS